MRVPGGPSQPVGARAPRPGRVRDRDVLALASAVVALVLIANVVTGVIRPLDDLLGFAPVVVVALVAVTLLVVIRSVRPARRPDLGDAADPGPADLE